MHIEKKNFIDNIFNTILDVEWKSNCNSQINGRYKNVVLAARVACSSIVNGMSWHIGEDKSLREI